MNRFQRYIFWSALQTLGAILLGLAAIAIMTQGLSQLDIIVDNRQSSAVYFWVTLLASPQIIALTLPIALFVATTITLNRAQADNELVVAQSAGMSRWQIASPVFRLAVLATLLHLVINLWVQPAAFREFREIVNNARTDIAASLLQEGRFITPVTGLTFYAERIKANGELNGIIIYDARLEDQATTYIASKGLIKEVNGSPAIILQNGSVQQLDENSALPILNFEQNVFDLSSFMRDDSDFVLKSSDRFLHELFFPDLSNYYDHRNQDDFRAEGHSRIASTLLNIVMAALALWAVAGGQFNRKGYFRRIAIASVLALTVRFLALSLQSAAQDDPSLNILQYLAIMACIIITLSMYLLRRHKKKTRRPQNNNPPEISEGALA